MRVSCSGLAWGDLVADAIISHYGQDPGGGGSQLVPCLPPSNPRCFTVRECARLQGFPNSYALELLSTPYPSSSTLPSAAATTVRSAGRGRGGAAANNGTKALYRMIGNAVCPPVIAAIAEALLRFSGLPARSGASTGGDARQAGTTEDRVCVALALQAVAPENLEEVLFRLGNESDQN